MEGEGVGAVLAYIGNRPWRPRRLNENRDEYKRLKNLIVKTNLFLFHLMTK